MIVIAENSALFIGLVAVFSVTNFFCLSNRDFSWKNIGTANGTNIVAIDSTKYRDICVIGTFGLNPAVKVLFNIPVVSLINGDGDGYIYINGAYKNDTDCHFASIRASKTMIALRSWDWNGRDCLNSSSIQVLAR